MPIYSMNLCPKTIVSSSRDEIESFLERNGEIVLKPLNRCFGSGVMYLKNGDKKHEQHN